MVGLEFQERDFADADQRKIIFHKTDVLPSAFFVPNMLCHLFSSTPLTIKKDGTSPSFPIGRSERIIRAIRHSPTRGCLAKTRHWLKPRTSCFGSFPSYPISYKKTAKKRSFYNWSSLSEIM